MKICGIYKIVNKKNRKCYYGQSQDIVLRIRRHKIDLKNNNHQNKDLQRAWNKYGKDNFDFSVFRICPLEQLNLKEQECLDLVKLNPKLYYNISTDAEAPRRGKKFSIKSRKKMSESAKRKFIKFPWLKNVIYTKERNEKISLSKKGNKNYNYGKHLSATTKQKLSEAFISEEHTSGLQSLRHL